jgi:leucyl-tRNA synthetase
MTRAFISACNSHLREAVKQLDNYNGRDYVTNSLHLMLREVEFYQKSSVGIPKKEKQSALRYILDPWNVILSPMIPHISEEINEKLGHKDYCSLKNIPQIELSEDSEVLMNQTAYIKSLIDDAQAIIDLKRDSPKKISIYIAPEWKQDLYNEISRILGSESFNMGKIMGKIKSNHKFSPKMKEIARELKSIRGDARIFRKKYIGTEKELDAIEGYKKYLSQHFDCPIDVYVAESKSVIDPLKKAFKAQPTKPALYMEF